MPVACTLPEMYRLGSERWEGMSKINHRGPDDTGRIPALPSRADRPGSTKAQTMLEFALVAPLFFLLLFVVIDFGRMFFLQMNLQNAVGEAGRFASTGNHLPDPNNPGQTLSRGASIIAEVQQSALSVNITNIQISSLKGGIGSAGGPGDIVTVSITTQVPLMTPIVARFFTNGSYSFTVSATFKNEPFPPANTR